MKIEKIVLQNFRQFYGDQSLELATGSDKNVTLVHAENGVGKTTILNSILWALFRDVTAKFEQKEKLVNFEALAENKSSASASIQFTFNDSTYIARRLYWLNKEDKFFVSRIENGVSKPMTAPDTFVNSVIPAAMARYFFFDGEAAELFSAELNYKQVGMAIRNMLGCDFADAAIDDLKAATKAIDEQIGSVPGEDDLKKLESELSETNSEIAKRSSAIEQFEKDIVAFTTQRDDIIQKLRESESARQIQLRRDEKERNLRQIKQDIGAIQEEVLRWIGQRSIQVVSKKLARETLDFINEASLKGKIPSPYNEEFVKGLLQAESCICHRPLAPQSSEWNAVVELLKSAGNSLVMGRVVRARARIQQLKEGDVDAPRVLELAQRKHAELAERRNKLEQEIEELGKQIERLPLSEIAERETARRSLDDTIRARLQALAVEKHSIQLAEAHKNDLEREITRLAAKSEKTRRLLRRRELVTGSIEVLRSELTDYEKSARGVIQQYVNEILERVARRDYRCRLDGDFSLKLLFSDGTPTPKSGGENQLLSLSFIASLIKYSELRANAKGQILTPGTIAPLVLDSPFGQLDTKYREDTARFIPETASQVVLLVTSSQGDARVLKALSPRVGAEYILISENRGQRGNKTEDRMEIKGKEYIGSLFGQPRNLTRIERIG